MVSTQLVKFLGIAVLAALMTNHLIDSNVIIKGPENHIAEDGDIYGDVELSCEVNESVPVTSVTWTRTLGNTTELIYTFDGENGTIIPDPPSGRGFKYRLTPWDEMHNRFTLYFYYHELSDAGYYTCEVESDGVLYAAEAVVRVLSLKSAFTFDPAVARPGTSTSFTCTGNFMFEEIQSDTVLPKLSVTMGTKAIECDSEEGYAINPIGEASSVNKTCTLATVNWLDYDIPLGCKIDLSNWGSYETTTRNNIQVGVDESKPMEISPNQDSHEIGDEITCEAFGFPTPSYRWIDEADENNPVWGGKLEVTKYGSQTWTCHAFNHLGERGEVEVTNSVEVKFTVSSSSMTLNSIPLALATLVLGFFVGKY